MSDPIAFKYRAFISYTHADSRWAKWLHGRLEAFNIDKDLVGRQTPMGPAPRRLRPIFRDRDEFTAGHTLTELTLAALDGSAALIVLCSPTSARSHYVNEEVRLFKERHPDRPIIPLILDGEPGDAQDECFPQALKSTVGPQGQITETPEELLAADVREGADGKSLALARVIAGLLGLNTDDVFRRAERVRRQKQNRWIVGLSGIVALLAGLLFWAEWNRRDAQENFALAKQGADALIVDIARGLRHVEGMQKGAVRKILGRADEVISQLIDKSNNNLDLLRSKVAMLSEFVETYIAISDTDKASMKSKEGLQLAKRVVALSRHDLASQKALGLSFIKAGDASIELGDFEEARGAYNESLELRRKLAQENPDDLAAQRDVSTSLNRLGELEELLGRHKEAKSHFYEGLIIRESLVSQEPKWKRDLIVSNIKLGDVALALKDIETSKNAFGKAVNIARELASDEVDTMHKRDLAITLQRLGNVDIEANDPEAAHQAYKESLDIYKRLSFSDPGDLEWKRDIAVSHMKLGNTAKLVGDIPVAIRQYGEAVSQLRALLNDNEDNIQWRIDLAEGLMHWAEVSTGADRIQSAKESRELLLQLKREKKTGREQEQWLNKVSALIPN